MPTSETNLAEPTARRFGLQPYLPLMALTTIIWGAAFPITKPGLADMPPATFAFLRFVITLIILLPPLFILRGGWHISRRDWGRVALAGLMGFALIQLGQNWGLILSLASDISVLAATEPISITLLAAFLLGEKPNRAVWLGLLVSLAGVLLVIGINPLDLFSAGGGAKGDSGSRILGDLIFLFGTLGWAAYNVITRSLSRRYNGLEMLTGALIFGLLGLAPFSLLELTVMAQPIRWSGAVVIGLVYSALLVTIFGFLALSWSLKRVPAAKVALLFYLQPLSGVLVAWLGGEQLSWNFGVGALLILAGVYLAEQLGQIAG